MRGADVQQLGMFSYVSVEERVPADHPIRMLRKLVDAILLDLDALLSSRYAEGGRASIPPERLLRASLLQVVFSVRSERLLMEQMQYNLLFRWFVGSTTRCGTTLRFCSIPNGCSTPRSRSDSSRTRCCWRACRS